eukprot:359290-Chlamydomonas_euryale.AAC.8
MSVVSRAPPAVAVAAVATVLPAAHSGLADAQAAAVHVFAQDLHADADLASAARTAAARAVAQMWVRRTAWTYSLHGPC